MNVKSLHALLTELLDSHEQYSSLAVVVETSDLSIGPATVTEVESALCGFDWNSGKLILKTKDKIKLSK